MTTTQTYNRITPANPYLRCDVCNERVKYWLSKPGPPQNFPCGHEAGYHAICPSWGPVDGCSCLEFLGYLPHPLENEEVNG
jgi:hypothetical protein